MKRIPLPDQWLETVVSHAWLAIDRLFSISLVIFSSPLDIGTVGQPQVDKENRRIRRREKFCRTAPKPQTEAASSAAITMSVGARMVPAALTRRW